MTETFQQIFEKYNNRIFNLLCSLCKNPSDAAELTQETFIGAYKSFENFRHDANAYTWLYRIAVNAWKNRLKYESIHFPGKVIPLENNDNEEIPGISVNEHLLEKMENKELLVHIKESIRKLPLKYRVPITLYLNNLAYEDISAILKCSVGQAKSLVFRAKNLIKAMLFENH